MKKPEASPYLSLLRNQIDVPGIPFSDRGSRLLVYVAQDQNHLSVKLAEWLTTLQPDIEAYLRRPPFIRDLCLVDEARHALEFGLEVYPHALFLQTQVGEFGLVFQNKNTLSFGLPAGVTAGLRLHVSPQFWEMTEQGGVFKSIRNLFYDTNAEIVRNQITPEKGGYLAEIIVQATEDSAINLTIGADTPLAHEVPPFSISLANAETRWHTWFAGVPPVNNGGKSTENTGLESPPNSA